jgi:hypothetical protein
MRRRLESRDFRNSHTAVFEARGRGGWLKYERYEIRDGEVVVSPDPERVLQRWLTNEDDDGWTDYDPIDDVPDLFLRFARLYGESDFNKAALDFANKYGLPTGADERPAPSGAVGFETDALNWSLAQFRHEARRAWVILALYEAVLNDEDRTVRKLLAEHGDIKPFKRWLFIIEPGPAEHQNPALAPGLMCAVEATEEIVHKYCRQRIMLSKDRDTRPSVSCKTYISWTFDNLLGAMYLQMYWLVASRDSVARCEHCGRIVSLGRPHPEGRKRRSDKRFCNDACRQAHHRSKKKRAQDAPS